VKNAENSAFRYFTTLFPVGVKTLAGLMNRIPCRTCLKLACAFTENLTAKRQSLSASNRVIHSYL